MTLIPRAHVSLYKEKCRPYFLAGTIVKCEKAERLGHADQLKCAVVSPSDGVVYAAARFRSGRGEANTEFSTLHGSIDPKLGTGSANYMMSLTAHSLQGYLLRVANTLAVWRGHACADCHL